MRFSFGASLAPRRILMTAGAEGGVWGHAVELCRGLGEAGVEVVLAVMGPPPCDEQLAAAARLPLVQLTFAPFRLEGGPWNEVVAAGAWLRELERRCDCEIVHLNGYAHGALPFASPKVVVGHSCALSRWRAVKGEEPPPRWDRYRAAVTAGLAGADRVVAPTAWMLGCLEEHYGPLPSAEVIPDGCDGALFGPGEKTPFVLGAGRLGDEAANAALLARAAERLPWPVRIARDRAQLAALYGAAAIFVSPACYEPFGRAVLEAALSECALVLSDIPPFRELWSGAAIFVPPRDEEALHTALATLMNQPELTAILALRARRRALAYSAERMVGRYLSLYRTLVAVQQDAEQLRSSCVS
jgi:glycosyltransferase involved in cell wall biosynthesis